MSNITLSHPPSANHYNYHTDIMNDLNNTNTSPSFEYTPYPAYNAFQTMGFVPSYQQYSRPKSPESISSVSSPSTPPMVNLQNNNLVDIPAPSTTDRVKEMITRANSVPMEFYHTEFLEYSKETYEKKKSFKRKRSPPQQQQQYSTNKKIKVDTLSDEDFEDDDVGSVTMSSAEVRRQIHIQSEQKRRAQIKDGFDELRKHLPGCNNKKMSKAALLTRTVQQLQHLKGVQNNLLSEVERLLQVDGSLKKFQQGVLERQAMEKMYTS